MHDKTDGAMGCTAPALHWTWDRYPIQMVPLPLQSRLKAIYTANALLDKGLDPKVSIEVAIDRAQKWAESRRIPSIAQDSLLEFL